jgi:hypothetical protein
MARTDAELVRRWRELEYRRIECAIDPDHPATRANRDRWDRERRQVQAELERRGLLERS